VFATTSSLCLLYLHMESWTLHYIINIYIKILYIPGHMVLKNTTKDLEAAKNVGKGGIVFTELKGNSAEKILCCNTRWL